MTTQYDTENFDAFQNDCRGKTIFLVFKSNGRTMSLEVKPGQLKKMIDYESIKGFSADSLSSTVFVSDFK